MFFVFMAVENEKDRDKATELFNRYYGTMLYIAGGILHEPHLAEDAVSLSFIKILKNLDKFDMNDCTRTRGLIVIIVRNTSIDMLRGLNHNQTIPLEEYMEDTADEPVIDQITIADACEHITQCISKLNKQYADILYLKCAMNYSNDEIQQILGISQNNVKMRLYRARKALKEMLREEEKGYEQAETK
ncbi:RNA polymerase sigma factor [Acetanaerobacterium elongatum]|uniref:RNA polymerase sigma-70 factor, ECF subfamily n=1 Tax=Acetanaerobacterium elongatum TaxID=258515 RepID=A0A1H0GFG4_9FIRM|nr:sigma-70 family RNA polymerase sigma factor [Acetanaerobacterium elongatum]SDO05626.1 RNA polymerase sigma-70 factor, ECF subfamily [Acetanaerobacterium elongatum]